MLKVNNLDFVWEQGLTVANLLEKLKSNADFGYLVHLAFTVIINQKAVSSAEYSRYLVQDSDKVFVVPMVVGG